MPIAETTCGSSFGMFGDKYGIEWIEENNEPPNKSKNYHARQEYLAKKTKKI